MALLSAAAFSTSGSFSRVLVDAGWSSAAVVTARAVTASILLAIPALLALRGRWSVVRRNAGMIIAYGVVPVAGCQLCYVNAAQRLSVGVALLLEYLGIVLVVLWMWLRHHQRPRRLTVVGSVVAVVGLALVIDVLGGAQLDAIGVLWALGAAFGLATYFMLSAKADDALPPAVLASGGMLIGAGVLAMLGVIGALPFTAVFDSIDFVGYRTSWFVILAGLALLAGAVGFLVGISAARRLGPTLASFVGLTEVMFAVLVAWVILGELPTTIQLAGGVLIIGGIALVRIDELRANPRRKRASG